MAEQFKVGDRVFVEGVIVGLSTTACDVEHSERVITWFKKDLIHSSKVQVEKVTRPATRDDSGKYVHGSNVPGEIVIYGRLIGWDEDLEKWVIAEGDGSYCKMSFAEVEV